MPIWPLVRVITGFLGRRGMLLTLPPLRGYRQCGRLDGCRGCRWCGRLDEGRGCRQCRRLDRRPLPLYPRAVVSGRTNKILVVVMVIAAHPPLPPNSVVSSGCFFSLSSTIASSKPVPTFSIPDFTFSISDFQIPKASQWLEIGSLR